MQLCNCFLQPWYLQTLSGQVQIYFGLSDVVKRPLNSNTSLPSRGLFNHRPALPYLPPLPSPHSAPQPHPHPPLASVCKAVSSFQHFQQMYVELKPVSNSCVYKTLFAQTRVLHLKLKPLSSLQCRWKVCSEWNWSINNPPSSRHPLNLKGPYITLTNMMKRLQLCPPQNTAYLNNKPPILQFRQAPSRLVCAVRIWNWDALTLSLLPSTILLRYVMMVIMWAPIKTQIWSLSHHPDKMCKCAVQGGRSYAKARRAFAKKFALGRKF